MNSCPHCGGKFNLNVVSCRPSKTKYLRTGCCDVALRKCPDPGELLRSPNLNLEERFYLQRLVKLDWFSSQVAAVLLQIEAKVGGVAV